MKLQKVFLRQSLFVCVVFLAWIKYSVAESCARPSPQKLQELKESLGESELYSIHPSFLSIPKLRGNITVDKKYINRRNFKFDSTSRKCPKGKAEHITTLCPTFYQLEYDENRIPNSILQARCRCRKCLRMKGHTCRPIHYYSRVLRVVGCEKGEYKYQEVWEKVSVGCTCRSNMSSHRMMT